MKVLRHILQCRGVEISNVDALLAVNERRVALLSRPKARRPIKLLDQLGQLAVDLPGENPLCLAA
jgi:hypothetical protein